MYEKCVYVGHLGADPEKRFTHNGTPVCNFRIAINKVWTDDQGNRQESVKWVRVVVWRKLADLCNEYLAKGRLVLVEGEMNATAWNDEEGKPHAGLELTGKLVRFLGGGTNGNGKPAPVQATDEEEIPF